MYSIDVLRGAVMIIMALDHVRDYFHRTAATDSPTNLLTTTPLLFFTRWITHFCAPTFVFLAGISAFLMGVKKTKKELRSFLISRGLWLVFAEVFIVSLGWTFNPFYNTLILQVIWAIGISMIILALLVKLPANAILMTGLLIILFHNLIDNEEMRLGGHVGLFWELAHHGYFTTVQWAPQHVFIILYAFLPWTGIMLTGYGFGRLFTSTVVPARRRKILYASGLAALLLFLILRSINHYGDPSHWYLQRNKLYTWLAFFNVSKYPPSLDYISLTIGVALIALAMLDRISKDSFSFLRVFGRVPFFYYMLHLYLIHLMAVVLFFVQGYSSKDIAAQSLPFLFRPDHFGFGLIGVYLIWVSVILILYPFCYSYDQYKSTHKKWWLSYV